MPARCLVLLCVLAVSCGREAPPPAEPVAIAVTAQAARIETLRETFSAPGTVVASALSDFTVTASESAQILEITKSEGEPVKEGDVLVRFEIPALTTSVLARQAEVTEAALRVENARAEVTRLTGFFDKGIVPRNAVDAARATLVTAEGQLSQANAALDAAKVLADRAVVRARFAGQVVKVWHKAGDMATADSADPILRVIDPTRTQVAMQVPAAQMDRLAPGLAATIMTAEGGTEMASISSRTAPAAGGSPTGEVRLSFLAPSSQKIDAPVQVEILLDERRDVVVVPEQAVVRDAGSAYVWIARPDGRAERRAVRLGLIVRGAAQALSGVAASELVIVTGLSQLQDGIAVTVSR